MSRPRTARARLGGLIKQGAPPERVDAARRDLQAAVAEGHVRIAASAPLTPAERTHLAGMLLSDDTVPLDTAAAEAVARALLPAARRLDARRGGVA